MMKKIIVSILALSMAVAAMAQKWAPVGENIKSPWAAEVNPSAPLPEYPRPQMVREEWQNLNGIWELQPLLKDILLFLYSLNLYLQ